VFLVATAAVLVWRADTRLHGVTGVFFPEKVGFLLALTVLAPFEIRSYSVNLVENYFIAGNKLL